MPALFNDVNMAWGNPFVAPDESYFIFNSSRPGGFGGTDLYISYKKTNGGWTNPKNLGNIINTATNECGSEITDDSLYMTYVSNNDIYWVGSGFIDSLRYTNFIPYVANSISDQTAYKGLTFNFTIPDSTFIDDGENDTLTFHAKLTNGDPLTGWLGFDTITGTFSGIPPNLETLNIRVTATDMAGASASTNFNILVKDPVSVEPVGGEHQGILIYPNPSDGLINISVLNEPENKVLAEVCNLQGNVLQKSSFEKQIRLDMTPYAPGIYFIRLWRDGEVTVCKISVQ